MSVSPDPLGRIADYRPRVVDAELASRLQATGAVLIEGPRGCGKTQTALQVARSAVRLDRDQAARAAGLLEPSLLLEGEHPRLIDEWQLVPGIWNQVRSDVDDHPGDPGRFILTGSAVPADDITRHSGALRFTRLRMRPMSLAESGHSSGDVSLRALFDGASPRSTATNLDIREIARLVVVGGWPGLAAQTPANAMLALQGYLEETRRVDMERSDGVGRDPENVARVLRSLARNVATSTSARSIAADIGGAEGPIDYHTVLDYEKALTRLFVIENLAAWSPALRSRSQLRTSPVHHFVDPSLAAAALGASPDRLLQDPNTLGLLFESLVVRDLRVYAQALGGKLFYYRENTGLEADAILQLGDGRWAGIEIKLGPDAVPAGAQTLKRVVEHVDVARHGEPAFLAVVTGWGFAYRAEDGVLALPIGTIAP
jgi:Predicted ATPase (AAA+ superfamily)